MASAAHDEATRLLLRQAFAGELAERLPRIEALTDRPAVRRDAHTLASSASVVGEPEIARLARAVEVDVDGGPRAELVALLRAWAP
ncbi:MAG: Hpt domain-containing protein [Mycobacteriales bacterium]